MNQTWKALSVAAMVTCTACDKSDSAASAATSSATAATASATPAPAAAPLEMGGELELKVAETPSFDKEMKMTVGAAYVHLQEKAGKKQLEVRIFNDASATCATEFTDAPLGGNGWGVSLLGKPDVDWTGKPGKIDTVDPAIVFKDGDKSKKRWEGGVGLDVTKVQEDGIVATIESRLARGHLKGSFTAKMCPMK